MTDPESIRPQALDRDVREALEQRLGRPSVEDEMLARVRTRVMSAIRQEQDAPLRTVRAGEGEWQAIAPGVQRKMLWVSAGSQSCLVRLAPGAVVHAHLHPADEECVVLEGSVRIGRDILLQAGDFHVGRSGSAHEATTSDTGALVYLRGAVDPVT